jgi:hypothetical protein
MGICIVGRAGLEHKGVGALTNSNVLELSMLANPALNGTDLDIGDGKLRHESGFRLRGGLECRRTAR